MIKINLTATIPETLAGQRLDQALAQLFPDYSRSKLKQWILTGEILVDGHLSTPKAKVAAAQKITLIAEIASLGTAKAENIPLNIIYQDEHLIVINKQAGLVVHPAPGNREGTLVNALLYHFPELEQLPRAGIVHRIDKDTTGLLLVARTLKAHTKLVQLLQTRAIQRHYAAIVAGSLVAGGTVDAPIGRHPQVRTKMAVVETGKPAVTHYRIGERFCAHTLLDISLETGRTHQIRVHMAHIHHPLVGDQTYGGRLKLPKNCPEALKQALSNFPRQALHAKSLQLPHPITTKKLHLSAPMPEDMLKLIRVLRADEADE